MNTVTFLPRPLYTLLFLLLGCVALPGLWVPLMDNDSAHHANIALHMLQSGDYASLVDVNGPYLDKPHFLFWTAAFSYKIFGVTAFAYKLPSFLFSISGVYSVYRLGRSLYNAETGRLSALIMASSFAFLLANNDVRMDAILTAAVAFAAWQLVDFIQTKKIIHTAGAALGLAIAFSTKGQIGVLIPAAGAFFYILYRKEYRLLLNPKWLLLLLLFGLGISPVLYCYYLQFNLHPELVVRDHSSINGIKFILLNQGFARLQGEMGKVKQHDYFFFFHSFLWAFAPWSVLGLVAVYDRLKNFFRRQDEWMSPAVFVLLVLLVTFSGFKLPHYLNILFPYSAIITARWMAVNHAQYKWIRPLQLFVAFASITAPLVFNTISFPVNHGIVYAGLIFLLALFIYLLRSALLEPVQKITGFTVASLLVCFYLMNTNFYPQLLTYQGGTNMSAAIKDKINPDSIYFWKNTYSSSFEFNTQTLRKPFSDSLLNKNSKIWLLLDANDSTAVKEAGYKLLNPVLVTDYEVSKLDIPFFMPWKREKRCRKMEVAEVIK